MIKTYDDLISKLSKESARSEINQIPVEDFLSQQAFQEMIDRFEGLSESGMSFEQHTRCNLLDVEVRGNKFLNSFMDPMNPNYNDYSKEITEMIGTFKNTTELTVFLFQILRLLRFRKISKQRTDAKWTTDYLDGV